MAMPLFAQEPLILAGTNHYSAYRSDLAPGAAVYVDADPAGATPVRTMQRALGYREVDYKAALFSSLTFSAVPPTTNGGIVIYDYSGQTNKTNLVGYWAIKDVPIVIAADGKPYIADGHHTTAGYLTPRSPVRLLVPGRNRVILGHILGNYYDVAAGPRPVSDAWWTARAAENLALLYGPDGDQLTQPGEPDYGRWQPILPSVEMMPASPSNITTNGATAMARSAYRSLAWGLVDAVVQSATDNADKKVAGCKKTTPSGVADIYFVEFFWADYLRRRVVWDDTLPGSPLGSPKDDANAISAPLSFFTATANGIALARSEVYRDEHGRRISDYLNEAVFTPNTVGWAAGSLSNGLAAAGDTYHLYLRDDSTIAGAIQPSALSTNILHIDTVAGLTVTQSLDNIRRIIINAGGTLKTSWKDATISNTTLRLPAGRGTVTITGTNFVAKNTILGGGTLAVPGSLRGSLQVTNGVLQGSGTVDGAVTISGAGTLAPGTVSAVATLTVNGPLTLRATTLMQVNKTGARLTNDRVNGISAVRYGGVLTLRSDGDPLVAGDTFKLFRATSYAGTFAALKLPQLEAGLVWDTSRLTADGTLGVTAGGMKLRP